MPAYDLELYTRSSTPVGALEDAQLDQVVWELNSPGQLDFTMSQDDAKIKTVKCIEHEIRCTIEGVTNPWQGPIWQDKQSPNEVKFNAENIASYLTRRHIDFSSMVFDDIADGYEQLQIGWALVAYANGQIVPQAGAVEHPRKSFNVTSANWTASGRKRLRKYLRNEHAEILGLLQEFGELRNFDTGELDGFDWEFITYADGRREWTPYSPMKGSLKTEYALEWGRNITDFTVDEDGKKIATKAYCTGGSTGNTKLETNYEDVSASDKYTQMTSIVQDGNQSDIPTLQVRARTHVEQHKSPQIMPDLETVDVPVDLLGKIETGDRLPIKIDRGRTQVDDIFRVGKITWKVRPNTLNLELMPKVYA